MGHYIVKYKHNNKTQWAVKENESIIALKEQPGSLRQLIAEQTNFLQASNRETEALRFDRVEILAPVSSPLRVVCQGLNYASHREEASLHAASKGNVMFAKDESSITGAYSDVMRPKGCMCLDYEVELGLVIKKDINAPVKVTESNLHEYVAGLVLANDMSPRDLQYRDDYAQWYKAKSCRTMLPLGPVLFLMDEEDFKKLLDLKLQLWVNDQLRQDANTSQLIFKPADTLSEISGFMNVAAGDLLLTGTPGGVVVKAPSKFLQGVATWLLSNEKKVEALRKHKSEYLQDGDVIKARIYSADGSIDLGTQTNKIVSYGF